MPCSFTIDGEPRTKKNHLRRIKRGKRVFSVQSEAHEKWASYATLQLNTQQRGRPLKLDYPVSLKATFYRKAETGDLGNYLSAVCDVLQASEVVANDSWIQSFDGSRLEMDPKNPRVELQLDILCPF